MSTTFLKCLAVGAFLAAPAIAQPAPAQHASHAMPAQAEAKQTPAPKLQAAMRSLWHGHILHTRAYANAVHANKTADAQRAADDVVANAKQISDAVAGFYGKPAGEQMLNLLAGHWGAVKAMTDAGQRGDAKAGNAAMATLTQNAGEIAVFLSGANPNLPEDAVRGLLVAHGAHHAAQIAQVMRGDLAGEKTTWTAMQAHMDTIADAMAAALAKQFPDKAA